MDFVGLRYAVFLNYLCPGVLRSSVDDPYDVMRRSRLVEPRSRARSISPHRHSNQRDSRSQSIARSGKDRKVAATDVAVSRTEWFDNDSTCFDESSRKLRGSFNGSSSTDDWLEEKTPEDPRNAPGRVVRVAKKPRNWQDANSSARSTETPRRKPEETASKDSRKSILECDVNPYLLVKKQMRDEDDLSDDLSDNALELEEVPSSSLFDPSKVKSIERVPNRNAVAAIGGQRIRVFSEPREISDEEEPGAPVTRIPIPKISPKRPPRRAKETRTTVKSILKRDKTDGRRKNVLFNINNVIFAPEKPPELMMTSRRTSRTSVNGCKDSVVESIEEQPIIPEEQIPERPKFITIPNIRDPKRSTRVHEPKIVPDVKSAPVIEKLKIDHIVASRRPEVPARNSSKRDNKSAADATAEETRSLSDSTLTEVSVDRSSCSTYSESKSIAIDDNADSGKTRVGGSETSLETIRLEDETELEIEIEELGDRLPEIGTEDKELLLKSGGKFRVSLFSIFLNTSYSHILDR